MIGEFQIGVGGVVLGEDEKALLNQVIDSNRLSYGPLTKEFEEVFAAEHDSKYGIFCNSGTSALHIALAALKEKYQWSDGDEVIVPATTFVATSNVVLHNNLTPVFVDVDSRTYNINPGLIEERITEHTRAIIPVHLFGLPADMDPILALAEGYDLKIIEDSCECMFADYKGKRVGSFGEVGCFSTYISHFLVTGTGGFCISSDPEIVSIIRSLMNHGRDTTYISIDDDKGLSEEKFEELIKKRFSFVHVGFNFKITELEAAIGLGQFKKREEMIRRRKEIAHRFMEEFEGLEGLIQLPFIPENSDHNFMFFPVVLKDLLKGNLISFLEQNNIETRDIFPLITQPVYRRLFGNLSIKDYPVSKWLEESGLYIGCHPHITDDEVTYIVDKFYEFFSDRYYV